MLGRHPLDLCLPRPMLVSSIISFRSKISSSAGLTFEKKGDTWYMYQDNPASLGIPADRGKIIDQFKGSIQVDTNGTVRIDSPDKKITIHPGGKWDEQKK